MYIDALTSYKQGQGAVWQADAPAGLLIVGAIIPPGELYSSGVNAGSIGQYGGDFYWAGGSSNIEPGQTSVGLGPFSSSYFGFLLVCGKNPCRSTVTNGVIQVGEITLAVRETSPPFLSSPTGLWAAKGWVRGRWTLAFSGNSPSGLCQLVAVFGNLPLPGSSSSRDPSAWHQCSSPAVSDSVVTQGYPQGLNSLRIGAWDAAGEIVNYTKTIYVDNQQPTVSLSGPTDAASTAGTQYVTATAQAGPSGVDGISCSVGGGKGHWYPGSTAHIPVTGIGTHLVRCAAANNAVDGSGAHGVSVAQTFTMKIGIPTVSAIAFSKIVDRVGCHHVRRGSKRRRVTKCHTPTASHRRTLSLRVRHGHAATVDGWLGTYTGAALPGQPVEVLAAADNGQRIFRRVTTVTTGPDGSWSARLPSGPSRLVEAAYGGGPTVQPSVSGLAREIVPAKIQLLGISPRQVAWGHTVRIVGRLEGGHLPPGGALVRLRIGIGSAFTTYGVHEHVSGNGRFATTYTFGLGDASVHRVYWFQIASLPMGNYPYAPANSRRLSVAVGGHPAQQQRGQHSRPR